MSYSPRTRSLVKTLTWRTVATIDTFIITWWITGKLNWAISIAGIEVITKMFLYYGHERVWTNIRWLKPKQKETHTQIFPFKD
jgi:uncharacterized membrane protein